MGDGPLLDLLPDQDDEAEVESPMLRVEEGPPFGRVAHAPMLAKSLFLSDHILVCGSTLGQRQKLRELDDHAA